jgi:hypothetical protein
MIATQPTLDLAPEPPCNHGASATVDGIGRCLLCPSTSADVLPLTPSDAGGGVAAVTVTRPRPVAPHETPAILAAVLSDPLPSRQTDREVIEAAIIRAAAEHGGLVTAAWVRPLVLREVFPPMWGAVLRPRKGFLASTGRFERNGGGSGNANKLAPVYRLVQH